MVAGEIDPSIAPVQTARDNTVNRTVFKPDRVSRYLPGSLVQARCYIFSCEPAIYKSDRIAVCVSIFLAAHKTSNHIMTWYHRTVGVVLG